MDKFNVKDNICEGFVLSFSNISDFRSAFRKQYKFLLAYHATNLSTKDLLDVQKNGLRMTTVSFLMEKVKERFIGDEQNNDIKHAIEEYFCNNEPHTLNEINFGLVKEDLFEHYHYLLFGSEALLPVADYLTAKYQMSYRRKMVETGQHYIVSAALPTDQIEDCWIDAIFDYFHGYNFPISLVYNYNLAGYNIINIQKVAKPKDIQNLMMI